jgi:hypothetical protein
MAKIASALSNQIIGFDCDCSGQPGVDPSRTFAFVFPNDPYNMTLCGEFFRIPRDGTDSKSGTIVHEVSHFTVVVGSDDFISALDQVGSRRLADSSPLSAIRNANAFEYFAENTPSLSMPKPADLVLVSANASNSNPVKRQSVKISGVIANRGDGVASASLASLKLTDTKGNVETTETGIPSLGAREELDYEFSFKAPTRIYESSIKLCLSIVSGDSNITNNCKVLPPIFVRESVSIAPIFLLLLDN